MRLTDEQIDYVMSLPVDEDRIIILPGNALDEGKSLGTSHPMRLTLGRDWGVDRSYHKQAFSTARKVGQTVGRRKLAEVQDRTKQAMTRLLNRFLSGKIEENELRAKASATMKTAWRDVFLAGLRAGGVSGEGSGAGKTLVRIDPAAGDEKWLKSAMNHEGKFLSSFLRDVIEGTSKMPIDLRLRAYVKTLESCYRSAQIIGIPSTCLVHWVGPGLTDGKACLGCQFLFEHSPYTKSNLVTVPKAGLTPCRYNCRDRLVVQRADASAVSRIEESAKYTRDGMLRVLRGIMRGDRV